MMGGALTFYDLVMWLWLLAFIAFLVFVFIIVYRLASLLSGWLSKSSPLAFKEKGNPAADTNKAPDKPDDKKNYSRRWFRDLKIFKRIFCTTNLNKDKANPVNNSNGYGDIKNFPDKVKRLSHTSRSIGRSK